MNPVKNNPVSVRLGTAEHSLLEALEAESTSQAFKAGLALLASTELTREIALYPKAVDSPEVDEKVEEAVQAACTVLDELFRAAPGVELRGINSNFQGTLADHIRAMLCGRAGAKLSHRREINALFADWKTFGRIIETSTTGSDIGFTVMRFGRGGPDLFLDPEAGKLVELKNLNFGATFTEQEHAVDGVLSYLAKNSLSPRQERLHMVAVAPSGTAEDDPLVVESIADISGERGMSGSDYATRHRKSEPKENRS
jgi:hypothetical protein